MPASPLRPSPSLPRSNMSGTAYKANTVKISDQAIFNDKHVMTRVFAGMLAQGDGKRNLWDYSPLVIQHLCIYHYCRTMFGPTPIAYLKWVFVLGQLMFNENDDSSATAREFIQAYERFVPDKVDESTPGSGVIIPNHIFIHGETIFPWRIPEAEPSSPNALWGCTDGSPWFRSWLNREDEARQLLSLAAEVRNLEEIDQDSVFSYHMSNFHRLRRTCGVNGHMYLQHVMGLAFLYTDEYDKKSEKDLKSDFAEMYYRWSGRWADPNEKLIPWVGNNFRIIPLTLDMIWSRGPYGELEFKEEEPNPVRVLHEFFTIHSGVKSVEVAQSKSV
ncbi:hypothetical protein PUNSTDRAFT_134392 [Punctularia strigosozonata HHB-11173 SS5]|uniref:uncharacterized protein n=1 Tax=Punctularia strigosozonata (strain HHB-11173) TaxID=741275 RepID=UPI0004417482|nr:uncharacterized protein PUNSTDRAFT_134392 [Punctularia strigosozonata HHB-11173 SS5]EIN09230.1 hypothetical protein PUNSTDRAFT_134392 [Punctularia strigosozonata HHB-11173 SS5]